MLFLCLFIIKCISNEVIDMTIAQNCFLVQYFIDSLIVDLKKITLLECLHQLEYTLTINDVQEQVHIRQY